MKDGGHGRAGPPQPVPRPEPPGDELLVQELDKGPAAEDPAQKARPCRAKGLEEGTGLVRTGWFGKEGGDDLGVVLPEAGQGLQGGVWAGFEPHVFPAVARPALKGEGTGSAFCHRRHH